MKYIFQTLEVVILITLFYSVSFSQDFGMVSINSQPTGAEVYINGESTGRKTPFQKPLAPGNYRYKLILENFQDYNGTFTVKESDITAFNVELNPEYSILGILAYPDAEIFVDGKKVGTRTYTGNLAVGNHKVEAKSEDYISEVRDVFLQTGRDTTIRFELQKIMVEYEFVSELPIVDTDNYPKTKEKNFTFYIKPIAGIHQSFTYNSMSELSYESSNNYVSREFVGFNDAFFVGGALGIWIKNFGVECFYQYFVDNYSWGNGRSLYTSSISESSTYINYYGYEGEMMGLLFQVQYPSTPLYFKSGIIYRLEPSLGYDYDYSYQRLDGSYHSNQQEEWIYNLNNSFGYNGGLGLNFNIFKFLTFYVEGNYYLSFSNSNNGYLRNGSNSNDEDFYSHPYNYSISFKGYKDRVDYDSSYLDYYRIELSREYNLSSISIQGGFTFRF